MYGLKPIGRYDGKANFAIQEFTTGATMVAGDPCYLLDGVLEMAVATGDVLGVRDNINFRFQNRGYRRGLPAP